MMLRRWEKGGQHAWELTLLISQCILGISKKNEHWVEEVGRFAVFMCHVKMTLGRYIGWSVFGQILKSLCSPEPVVPTASFKRTSEILNS